MCKALSAHGAVWEFVENRWLDAQTRNVCRFVCRSMNCVCAVRIFRNQFGWRDTFDKAAALLTILGVVWQSGIALIELLLFGWGKNVIFYLFKYVYILCFKLSYVYFV